MIYVPQRRGVRTTQPQGFAELDTSHWAAKRCQLAYLACMNYDAVSRTAGSQKGVLKPGKIGLGVSEPQVNNIGMGHPKIVVDESFTTVVGGMCAISGSGHYLQHGAAGKGWAFTWSNGYTRITFFGVADYALYMPVAGATYDPRVYVLTYNKDTKKARVYENGVFKAEVTVGTMIVDSTLLRYEGGGSSYTGWAYAFVFSYLFQGVFSDEQIISMSNNPWQIFL